MKIYEIAKDVLKNLKKDFKNEKAFDDDGWSDGYSYTVDEYPDTEYMVHFSKSSVPGLSRIVIDGVFCDDWFSPDAIYITEDFDTIEDFIRTYCEKNH